MIGGDVVKLTIALVVLRADVSIAQPDLEDHWPSTRLWVSHYTASYGVEVRLE
jgi:hypothetical protein